MELRDSFNYLPTKDETQHYSDHGWLITPPILDFDILEEAKFAALRLYEGERDSILPISGGYLEWTPDMGDGLRMNDYASLQLDAIRNLIMRKEISAYATALTNSKKVRLFHDQLIGKPRNCETVVGWHVDVAYWGNCTSDNLVTAWIPFDDTEIESGPLTFIDKSHNWEGTETMNSFNDQDLNRLAGLSQISGKEITEVPVVVKKGQISFHHPRLIHGSRLNASPNIRIALALHIQPQENRYKVMGGGGVNKLHINDLICRKTTEGFPDYTDDDVFPELGQG